MTAVVTATITGEHVRVALFAQDGVIALDEAGQVWAGPPARLPTARVIAAAADVRQALNLAARVEWDGDNYQRAAEYLTDHHAPAGA